MAQFFVKRLIGLFFVVIGVSFITFILGYFAPGDPIYGLLGPHYTARAYQALKHAYGLDLPWYQQYARYLHNLCTLDFGFSYAYKNRPVAAILASGVPVSLELGLWGLLFQWCGGIPLGMLAALKSGTWLETISMGVVLVLYALPVFVLALVVQLLILQFDRFTGLNWPAANWGAPWSYSWPALQHKLAPILVYAASGVAYYARLTRTALLEILKQDYVRTARAKGLRERVVMVRHALRNALVPLITAGGVSLGFLVTGVFFVESIFNIPGIANITLFAIANEDYPVIQATTVLLAVTVVLGNTLADLLYTVVDPRIKMT